jgi:hypothetical protein
LVFDRQALALLAAEMAGRPPAADASGLTMNYLAGKLFP